MNTKEICQVIPKMEDHSPLLIVNCVNETNPPISEGLQSLPTYRLHYVTAGRGLLYTPGVVQLVQEGDVFFSMPGVPYSIAPEAGMKYIYISYLGPRAKLLHEELKLGQSRCVFHGFKKMAPMWKKALTLPAEVINLRCESLLLQVFSEIGIDFYKKKEQERQERNAAVLIKKCIDENYADPDMTLEKVGDMLGYNRKYVSAAFKEEFDMGFINYLNAVRVHQACVLMEAGYDDMDEITSLCGFRNQYYFGQVFKEHMNELPSAHLKALRKEATEYEF